MYLCLFYVKYLNLNDYFHQLQYCRLLTITFCQQKTSLHCKHLSHFLSFKNLICEIIFSPVTEMGFRTKQLLKMLQSTLFIHFHISSDFVSSNRLCHIFFYLGGSFVHYLTQVPINVQPWCRCRGARRCYWSTSQATWPVPSRSARSLTLRPSTTSS